MIDRLHPDINLSEVDKCKTGVDGLIGILLSLGLFQGYTCFDVEAFLYSLLQKFGIGYWQITRESAKGREW